jgi:tetratricopeptide (TPR) repeat protein
MLAEFHLRSQPPQLEEAITYFRVAIALRPQIAIAHNNLAIALSHKCRLDEAIAEYRETVRLKKNSPVAHINLAKLLNVKGQLDEAIAEYREALRIYSADFAAQPQLADDLKMQYRYNAACCAALLAGYGQVANADKLDAKALARLRQQALDWLWADLKAYRQMLERSEDKTSPEIAQQMQHWLVDEQRMQHWLVDKDLAAVRSDQGLAKLPETERKEWQKLWEEVEALRQRTAQPPKPASAARP